MGSIVVGVDESESSGEALRWAVDTGSHRGWSVTALLAWSYLDQHEDGDVSFRPDYTEQDAKRVLDGIVSGAVPDASVDKVVVCDLPARALLEASEGAEMLVVGARGLGDVRGALLGSVSQQCVHHATVPVAIVRPSANRPASERIVVGVDGSEGALRALQWALDDARAREAAVTVVQASDRRRFAKANRSGGPPDGSLIADALARSDTDGVSTIDRVMVDDSAANALLAAAEDATQIVVGSRGRGGFARLLLGSVSQHVVNHAPCVTVVVPPADRTTG